MKSKFNVKEITSFLNIEMTISLIDPCQFELIFQTLYNLDYERD
jgi:hypothetical protein